MSRGTVSFMEEVETLEAGEAERDSLLVGTRPEVALAETPFVGAFGLSVVRELTWVLGLAEIDEPALWEPA